MPNDKYELGRFKLTQAVQMFHPNLLKPRAFMRNGKAQGDPKYSATLAFTLDSVDLKHLQDKAVAVARAEWPGLTKDGWEAMAKPWVDGNKVADTAKGKGKDGEYNRGKMLVAARSGPNYPPKLSVVIDRRVVDLDTDALIAAHGGRLFFGADVFAEITLNAHEAVGGNAAGVNAYLNRVLATGTGTKIRVAGASGAEAFSGYIGHLTAEDPTGAHPQNDNTGGW